MKYLYDRRRSRLISDRYRAITTMKAHISLATDPFSLRRLKTVALYKEREASFTSASDIGASGTELGFRVLA